MIRLRLFAAEDPSRQIDARMIGADPVTIGRDASADWVIADPDRALSRKHCTVRAAGAGVSVRDTSANGTFVGERGERASKDADTLVAPGESIRIGNYMLSVEALAGDPAPAPKVPTRGLFEAPRGLDPVNAPQAPRRVDPFASQIVPDPLLVDHRPAIRAPLSDNDAWDTKPAARAGDWSQPDKRHRDHENLIGTPQIWAEPARADADAGYGFDAPFTRPMMAAVPVSRADVGIPADWDEVPATASSPPVALRPAPTIAPIIPEPPVVPSPTVPPAPSIPEPVAPAVVFAEPTPVPMVPIPTQSVPPPAPAPIAPAPFTPAPLPPAPIIEARAAPRTGEVSAAPPFADAALFDAFCAGARLAPAAFAGEDRAAVMAKLGEVYRAMVLGLADLMSERTALKNEYRMTRTMVRPEGNNPFKWVPPQRLAVEVLRGGEVGFANGPEAVTEGFRDIKVHLLCMLAGLRAALGETMEALSPAKTEERVEGRFLIKAQRDAALWAEYRQLHERFRAEADDNADSAINRAFRSAYEKQLTQLIDVGGGYASGSGGGARH